MSTILIILVIVVAAIGALVGFFRKFTKTSFFGITVLLALLFERMIGTSVKKDSASYGIAVLLTAIIALAVLSAVLLALRQLLANAVAARRTLSEYKNYDDMAESDALILNAVDNNDRREYKRQLRKKKKIKNSAGIWGILDRVFGTVSGCLNALVGVGAVVVFVLLFADLSGISFIHNAFSAPLSSSSWTGLGTDIAVDLIIVCTLPLSIHVGYTVGVSSAFCSLIVFGLVVAFGIASWSIACSEACAGAVEGLKNGLLASLAGTLGGAVDIVAKVIIAAILFALSLIIIIVAAIFLPKLVDRFRENKVFNAVDGIIGAVIMCAIITMLLISFGGMAYTLHDLPFMEQLNVYAGHACIGDGIYACNPMGAVFEALPIRKMFGD